MWKVDQVDQQPQALNALKTDAFQNIITDSMNSEIFYINMYKISSLTDLNLHLRILVLASCNYFHLQFT